MSPPRPAPDTRKAATMLAPRLAPLLRALAILITYRFPRHTRLAPLVTPLYAYLTSLSRRLAATLARIATGRPPRKTQRTTQRTTQRATPAKPHKPKFRLPAGKAWLIRALPNEAVTFRGYIETLLAEPEIAALLAEHQVVRRLLAPIRRALADEQPKIRRKTPPSIPHTPPQSPPPFIPLHFLFPQAPPKIEA